MYNSKPWNINIKIPRVDFKVSPACIILCYWIPIRILYYYCVRIRGNLYIISIWQIICIITPRESRVSEYYFIILRCTVEIITTQSEFIMPESFKLLTILRRRVAPILYAITNKRALCMFPFTFISYYIVILFFYYIPKTVLSGRPHLCGGCYNVTRHLLPGLVLI